MALKRLDCGITSFVMAFALVQHYYAEHLLPQTVKQHNITPPPSPEQHFMQQGGGAEGCQHAQHAAGAGKGGHRRAGAVHQPAFHQRVVHASPEQVADNLWWKKGAVCKGENGGHEGRPHSG